LQLERDWSLCAAEALLRRDSQFREVSLLANEDRLGLASLPTLSSLCLYRQPSANQFYRLLVSNFPRDDQALNLKSWMLSGRQSPPMVDSTGLAIALTTVPDGEAFDQLLPEIRSFARRVCRDHSNAAAEILSGVTLGGPLNKATVAVVQGVIDGLLVKGPLQPTNPIAPVLIRVLASSNPAAALRFSLECDGAPAGPFVRFTARLLSREELSMALVSMLEDGLAKEIDPASWDQSSLEVLLGVILTRPRLAEDVWLNALSARLGNFIEPIIAKTPTTDNVIIAIRLNDGERGWIKSVPVQIWRDLLEGTNSQDVAVLAYIGLRRRLHKKKRDRAVEKSFVLAFENLHKCLANVSWRREWWGTLQDELGWEAMASEWDYCKLLRKDFEKLLDDEKLSSEAGALLSDESIRALLR
jgi:hypothetical protein